MDLEYIACFFCAEITEFDYIEKTLKEYDIGNYAIAYEDKDSKGEDKPHFHILFTGTKQIYNTFSKRLVEKYNLRRSGHGGKNKYGKCKEIRDLEKMLAYTIKDDCFRTDFTGTFLEQAIKTRFKKTSVKTLAQECLEHINNVEEEYDLPFYQDGSINVRRIKEEIISFLLLKDMTPSKSKLNYYLFEVIRMSKVSFDQKKEFFQNQLLF